MSGQVYLDYLADDNYKSCLIQLTNDRSFPLEQKQGRETKLRTKIISFKKVTYNILEKY